MLAFKHLYPPIPVGQEILLYLHDLCALNFMYKRGMIWKGYTVVLKVFFLAFASLLYAFS